MRRSLYVIRTMHAHAAIGEAFGCLVANKPISSPFFRVHVHVHHDRLDKILTKQYKTFTHSTLHWQVTFQLQWSPMQIAVVS